MRRVLALVLVAAALSAVQASPVHPQRLPDRIRITAAEGESLLVHGEYPQVQSSCVDPTQPVLHARYRGTIEVLRAADGSLSLIGELSFEDYVKGIAEVPRDWPMEALKAQVVAARTYALNRMQEGSGSGEYDLCATTSCQVYVGMEVEAGAWGDRWIRAVDDTAGQVLLYQGEPALTYYSSTSPGRRFDAEDVFGGEALPYLRGGPERDDRASPVSRWRVEVPFDDLARFLSIEGLWGGGAIREVRAGEGSIRIAGARSVTISKDSLRDALNETASCVAPERYPTYEQDGYRLPSTVPSRWFRAVQEGRSIVLEGRGWGHGVGMVQWGAYGKAQRGLPYDQILAEYYGGLRPQPVALPDRIRILIADGLTALTIAPSGEVQSDPSIGPGAPWEVTPGRGLNVSSADPPAPVLEATAFRPTARVAGNEGLTGHLTLSEDANVRLELRRGQRTHTTSPLPFEEGDVTLEFPPPVGVPPGRYEVVAIADDGVDQVSTEPARIRVLSEVAATTPAEPSPPPAGSAAPLEPETEERVLESLPLVVGGIVVVAVLVLLALALGRRKGSHAG